MTFTRYAFTCHACGAQTREWLWNYQEPAPCPCGGAWIPSDTPAAPAPAVHDDQLEGGARWCETMAETPVWLDGTKSQYRQLCAQHCVVNIVRHDDRYYRTQRQRHDEELRETGTNREY
jgi:hypothetical protein